MPDALKLLATRRSFKAVELAGPGPSAAEIDTLLTVASRVPDHGKLTPWRFIVFEGEARRSAGAAIATAFRAKYPDAKPEHVEAEGRASAACTAGHRRGEPRRAARENSGMGTGAVRRCRRHEPGAGCARARLWRQLDHRMVRLRSRRARRAGSGAARAHRRLCSHRQAAGSARGSAAAAARRDRHPLCRLSARRATLAHTELMEPRFLLCRGSHAGRAARRTKLRVLKIRSEP